jgi:GT2 family glycosyltransferase
MSALETEKINVSVDCEGPSEQTDAPTVAIVILNWNGKQLLSVCLNSMKATDYSSHHVIVVDNGSHDGSANFIRENHPGIDVLKLSENYGYAKGCNEGIKYALKRYDPDYVLLLNNDVKIIDGSWLGRMVAASESDEKNGIIGCQLVFPDGRPQYVGNRITPCGFPGLPLTPKWTESCQPFAVDAIIGAVFMVKRVLIERIGFLDEGFSPFLAEDMDYCARARRAGFGVKVVPSAKVIHYTNQTMKREAVTYLLRIAKKNEMRFRFLNLSLLELVYFAACESYNVMAHMVERKDKGRRFGMMNMKLRLNWKNHLECFFYAYMENFKNIGEIFLKRMNRSKKLWG